MTPAPWNDGSEYLVQAVSWAGGRPQLDLVEVVHPARRTVPLVGTTLAFTVRPDRRYCVGRYVFVGSDDLRLQECAGRQLAVTGEACAACGAADEFRFIHQVHRGGYASDGLRIYLAQPHWVYVATFADASGKVGTVAHVRKGARLDEQGAVRATYLTRAENGLTARVYEDALTEALGLGQTKRRAAKVAALGRPRSVVEIERAHDRAVEEARVVLARSTADLPLEPWPPPRAHGPFFTSDDGFVEYPHTLRSGDHRLSVLGLVGGTALVTVNEDRTPFVVDLGALKGRRVTPGPVHTPETQMSLF